MNFVQNEEISCVIMVQ